jgi:hypothetical protein
MKTSVMLLVFVSGLLLASMHPAASAEDQPALVVSVESHDPQSNSNYAAPLDRPLQPQIYSYDIDIRVGSTIYRTSFESAFDDLPAVLATNHPIRVNLTNHVMYVTLPGDRTVRLAIESRGARRGASCPWSETGLSDR